jgi:hypothetical protein
MLLLSVFFEQQDLADPMHRKEKFNYGQGSQQDEPPLVAPYLPQGSQYPCAQGRKKKSLGSICRCTYKRKQDKESKAKVVKRRAIEAEDSSSSEDSISVNNLEKPLGLPRLIPRSSSPRKRTRRMTIRKWTLDFCLL